MEEVKEIVRALKAARILKGYESVVDVSKRTGISRPTLHKLESGGYLLSKRFKKDNYKKLKLIYGDALDKAIGGVR